MTEVRAATFPTGALTHVAIAATAGNVVTNITPPAGFIYMVESGKIALVNDAAGGNRHIDIQKTDGTNVVEDLIRNTAAITGGQTGYLNFGEHNYAYGVAPAVASIRYGGIRPIYLEVDDQLRVTITSGLAADSYSGYITVRKIAKG